MKYLLLLIAALLAVGCNSQAEKHSALSDLAKYRMIDNRIKREHQKIYESRETASPELKARIEKGIVEQQLYPGRGTCSRCGRPWGAVEGHATWYTEGHGCFPLCEECWEELTPEQRLPYYRQWIDDSVWQSHLFGYPQYAEKTENMWPELKKAVLAGK